MKNSPTEQLNNCLRECLNLYNEGDIISPENLAACTIDRLDKQHISIPVIEWGCNLQLRQMARQLLRKLYDPVYTEKDDSGQKEMFSGLQDMYPGFGDRKGSYVPRMDLTLEERNLNLARMRKEVEVKILHIDAFQGETDYLVDHGFFSKRAT